MMNMRAFSVEGFAKWLSGSRKFTINIQPADLRTGNEPPSNRAKHLLIIQLERSQNVEAKKTLSKRRVRPE